MKIKTFLPAFAVAYLVLIAFTPDANAFCGYPSVKLSVAQGERGAMLTVQGQGFWQQCVDVGPGALVAPFRTPAKGIKVQFIQGGQSIVLATVDADANLSFSLNVSIPANAAIGNATLIAIGDVKYDATPRGVKPWEVAFQVVENR